MKRLGMLLTSVAVLGISGPFAGRSLADDKPASAENKLAPLEPFLGEWEVHGRWASGDELHARNVIEWGIGKKFITAKTFVKDGAREYQRYDAVMGWNPKKKSLFQTSYTYAGDINDTIIEPVEKDTLHIGWKAFDPSEPSKVRQIIKFTGKDSYVWTVFLNDGTEWKKLIEATWTRKK
jgi:hypothetical protein